MRLSPVTVHVTGTAVTVTGGPAPGLVTVVVHDDPCPWLDLTGRCRGECATARAHAAATGATGYAPWRGGAVFFGPDGTVQERWDPATLAAARRARYPAPEEAP